jgi:hypothetical protein
MSLPYLDMETNKRSLKLWERNPYFLLDVMDASFLIDISAKDSLLNIPFPSLLCCSLPLSLFLHLHSLPFSFSKIPLSAVFTINCLT